MSSSDRTALPFRIPVIIIMSGLLLSACGFRPLYGKGATSANTPAQLSVISIKPIPDRAGQILHTELQRRLMTRTNVPSEYSLTVSLTESVTQLAIERSSFATRANLTLTASYALIRTADRHSLITGTVRSVSSYNIVKSQFAMTVAKDDARKRGISAVADDIHTRLAVYFNGPGRTNTPASAPRP